MKKLFTILAIFGMLYTNAQSDASEKVFSKDSSKYTMEDCDLMEELWNSKYSNSNYIMRKAYGCRALAVDRELNRVYQELLKSRAYAPELIEQIRAEQREWIKTRDVYFETRNWDGQEVRAICRPGERVAFLQNRINYFYVMIPTEPVEGDICSEWLK